MSQVVVGIGLTTTATAHEVQAAVTEALSAVAREWSDVAMVATTARRRDHPAVVALGARGVTIRCFEPAELAAVAVPRPSDIVAARAGTASVAEAASLLGSGAPDLLLAKQVGRAVTVALSEPGEVSETA